MKIVYILKKGFQHYPPCLTQVLYLNDLGADLLIYHGKNSDYIDSLFDSRHIEHYDHCVDRDSENKFESAVNYYRYIKKINKIIKQLPEEFFIWFGNCESAIAVRESNLIGRRYLLSILELYDPGTIYDKGIKRLIGNCAAVICCEKHRAAIMCAYYKINNLPIYVMPNKPYDGMLDNLAFDIQNLRTEISEKLYSIKDKYVILYQGIITPDRPLDKIAAALNILNDTNIVFVVLGRATDEIQRTIKQYYQNVIFLGYVPSPQHLLITQNADIGIANYDYSSLNNIFCAPNKIYEYARFGIPMLVSENIGLTETVGACGAAECVNFLSINDIANGLNKIINNYQMYSYNAKIFYNITNNKQTIESILHNIIY